MKVLLLLLAVIGLCYSENQFMLLKKNVYTSTGNHCYVFTRVLGTDSGARNCFEYPLVPCQADPLDVPTANWTAVDPANCVNDKVFTAYAGNKWHNEIMPTYYSVL